MTSRYGVVSLCVLFLCISGCVQTKPVPGYARTGDNVIFGLGGIQRNSGGTTQLQASDLSIVITDSVGAVYPLAASHVFRSYPEYSALVNAMALDGSLSEQGLVPFDGGWFALVPLIHVGGTYAPLPLAEGLASVSITSNFLNNTQAPNEGDLVDMPLEIIAGVSTANPEYLHQFASYLPSKNSFVIAPEIAAGSEEVFGAYIKIDYSDESYFKDGLKPVVVPMHHNPYIQLAFEVVSSGDGTGYISISLLNPSGFHAGAPTAAGLSSLADLSLALLYFPTDGGDVETARTKFSLNVAQSYYINEGGDVIDTITPALTHSAEL